MTAAETKFKTEIQDSRLEPGSNLLLGIIGFLDFFHHRKHNILEAGSVSVVR
jgi:hypothetical protein